MFELNGGGNDKDRSNDTGWYCGPESKFKAGTTYRVMFTLEAKDDEKYYFAPDMTVTVNGSEAIKENGGEGFYKVYAYYYFEPEIDPDRKAPMSGFKAPAISAPVTGKTPMQASSLSLKGIVGELETTDLYIAGMTWYIDANNNGMLDEGEGTAADFNEDGTFKANTVYRVQMAIALSNDEDEDGVDDTTGICLPENEEDIPDFPAMVDGEFVTMDKEYSDAMLVYTYVFPATEGEGGILGDVDGDEKITTSDASAILRYIVGYVDNGINIQVGDVDNDDKITTSDASAVLRYIVGYTDNPNIGKPIQK